MMPIVKWLFFVITSVLSLLAMLDRLRKWRRRFVISVMSEYLSNTNINLDQRPPISTMACEADDARY